VEKVLNELGEEFSGVTKPENETDYYAIRYAEFVMPLVNAVQEQQVYIEEQQVQMDGQQVLIEGQQDSNGLQQVLIESFNK
jgi:type IV secretory pathway protease TraF